MTDAPDDFDYSNVGEFTANLDSSELAARLYSPAIYARSGQVLFMSDFSRGFSGMFLTTEVGYSTITLKGDYSLNSGLAAKLYTISDNDGLCALTSNLPLIKARYYTVDLGFVNDDTRALWHHYLYIIDESMQHILEYEYRTSPFRIRLRTTGNVWYDITSLENSDSYFGAIAHIRATIDKDTGKFHKFSINAVDFNVAEIDYLQAASVNYNKIGNSMYLAKSTGANTTLNLSWIVISASDNAP